MMTSSHSYKWASVFAIQSAISVAAGAFGAHGLANHLNGKALDWWHTASQYLMYHSLAGLIASVLFVFLIKENLLITHKTFVFFLLGNIFFAGSLYAMSLTGYTLLGAVTPLGGICYLSGWFCLAWNLWQSSRQFH